MAGILIRAHYGKPRDLGLVQAEAEFDLITKLLPFMVTINKFILSKRVDESFQFVRDHSPLIKRSRFHYFSWFLHQFPRSAIFFKGHIPYLVIFERLARWKWLKLVWLESSHQLASIPTIFEGTKTLLSFLLTLFVRDCRLVGCPRCSTSCWLVSLEGVGARTLHTDITSTYYGCLLQTKAHIEEIFETSTI